MVLKKLKREAEFALRHLTILRLVKNNQPIGIFKLSELVNLPKHRVRYSLRVLEQAGIIEPTQHGAKIREDANLNRLKNEIKEIKSIIEELEKKIEEVCK